MGTLGLWEATKFNILATGAICLCETGYYVLNWAFGRIDLQTLKSKVKHAWVFGGSTLVGTQLGQE
jgi:hypothetical protein